MSDEVTRAATEVDETAQGQVGTTSEPARDAETAEQKAARLERELENERGKQAAWQQRIAEAEARAVEVESNATPPTGATPTNPTQKLISEMQWYQQRIANAAANNQYDPEAERLLRLAQQDYQGMQWQAIRQRELPKLARVPEKYRAKTQDVFDTGRFLTMEDAAIAAQGIVLAQEAEAGSTDAARRRAADEAAARAAAAKPDTGGGSGREPAAAMEPTKMTGSEWKRRIAGMTRTAAEAEWKKLDSGQLQVDWTR